MCSVFAGVAEPDNSCSELTSVSNGTPHTDNNEPLSSECLGSHSGESCKVVGADEQVTGKNKKGP